MLNNYSNRAVFLDRDGVLNKIILNQGKPFSPRRIEDLIIVPDVKENLTRLKNIDYILIVITNQPEIARGLLKQEELDKMNDYIFDALPIDDLYYCPHDDPDNCACRKPKPGMLYEAASKWRIDFNQSFFIGDTKKDMLAAGSVGCASILIDASYNHGIKSDVRVKDFSGAVDHAFMTNK